MYSIAFIAGFTPSLSNRQDLQDQAGSHPACESCSSCLKIDFQQILIVPEYFSIVPKIGAAAKPITSKDVRND
jgi:hypothetical protein